jgi:hypothetical protein
MRENKTTFQKHLGHITQTQLLAQSPQNSEENNVGGHLKIVKRGACSFIEGTSALWAVKDGIAQFCFLRSLPGRE